MSCCTPIALQIGDNYNILSQCIQLLFIQSDFPGTIQQNIDIVVFDYMGLKVWKAITALSAMDVYTYSVHRSFRMILCISVSVEYGISRQSNPYNATYIGDLCSK